MSSGSAGTVGEDGLFHTCRGDFHVAKYEVGGSVVIDIWPVKDDELAPDGILTTKKKVCGLELEPDGAMYIRSLKRGAWEAKFLAYAAAGIRPWHSLGWAGGWLKSSP